jgi:hypothetical protein
MSLKYISLPVALVVGHTAFVAYQQQTSYSTARKVIQTESTNPFNAASTDDLILDQIQSGDIIVFRRKWYLQYLPMALTILAYRQLTSSEFDHLGITLVDKYGKVWLLENTPFQGIRCELLSIILEEQTKASEIISLTGLLPRQTTRKPYFQNPQQWTQQQFLQKGSTASSSNSSLFLNTHEFLSFTKFIFQYWLNQTFSLPSSSTNLSILPMCPNMKIFQQVYQRIGIDLQSLNNNNNNQIASSTGEALSSVFVTLQDFEDKKLKLKTKKIQNREGLIFPPTTERKASVAIGIKNEEVDQEEQEFQIDHDSVLLRTR